ncbi:Ribonuclease 3 [Oscillatoria nigro-viridis PCC 7112]|uniref:Ribonuclease 3 n=1 Tax=Phormidium nigroviride PCC 7112 TaxID=179408 RepID=K9VI30_9CYAN|nr:ribonuclease III [Oscillatoria nigro-viridis]AFZ07169.1 Ribonuclease 3 [Oscillatoria nigro-viridis PCC 7112]
MAISNRGRIDRALNLLCQGLYPYLKQEMQGVYSNSWEKEAKSCLPKHKPLKQKSADSILSEDVAMLLLVMSKQWDKVFNEKLNSTGNGLVTELIQVRNDWAHQVPFSTANTYRALDSIARLLKAVSAPQADIKEVEKQQQEVLRLLSQEQTRQENRHFSAEEDRIRERLSDLLKRLPFQEADLLNQALTHRSYLYENPKAVSKDNQLLEFLGDALLTFLSGQYLYRHYSNKNEGDLTRLRSLLVEDKQLAKFAAALNIGQWMLLGRGEATSGGTAKESLLSNTFEAIIGAYFLDSGIEAVRDFVEPLFTPVVEELISSGSEPDSNIPGDPKNQLQECVHQNIGPITPQYITIQEAGPDHAKEFTVEVRINGQVYGQGSGRSKKEAEKRAAEAALKKLRLI